MAYVTADFYLPRITHGLDEMTSFGSATSAIDATGEKIAMFGPVKKTGNIRNIAFRFQSVTKAGGSGLTASLQDLDLTSGPVARPDGTADQTVAIANGDASFASNTAYLTGNLSADRAVTRGDLLAFVLEYDGSGRLGSDSVSLTRNGYRIANLSHGIAEYLSSAWALTNSRPFCTFKYDDGTYSGFEESPFFTGIGNLDFHSGSTPDEYALEFSAPFSGKIDGGWVFTAILFSTSDFSMILYEGTTALKTAAIDANTLATPVSARVHHFVFPTPQEVTAGTTYRLAKRPDSTNRVLGPYYMDVPDAAYFDGLPGEVGTEMAITSRTDAGSWAAVTSTRRPQMGVHYCAIDVGSSGGGLLVNPGLRGGFL